MPQQSANIYQALKELGASGCQGNVHDFSVWLKAVYQIQIAESDLQAIINQLVEDGHFTNHHEIKAEYLNKETTSFPGSVKYQVLAQLNASPIQMVRSRLEAFLRNHGAPNLDIVDISIATTEAMENAVKYSDHGMIDVEYSIENKVFQIKIVNKIGDIKPEADIESGKYSGSITLMRGMMVMVKLFDEVDIDIAEDKDLAIFTAKHVLGKK